MNDLPLSLLFYDCMYTIIKKDFNEEAAKIGIVQLMKARKMARDSNPFSFLVNESYELPGSTEDDKKGISSFDKIANKATSCFDTIFKQKTSIQKFEHDLQKDVPAIQKAPYVEIDITGLEIKKIYSHPNQNNSDHNQGKRKVLKLDKIIADDNNFDNDYNLKNPMLL